MNVIRLLIIYFIFKHILLTAQNRPESDADGERSDRIAFRNPHFSKFFQIGKYLILQAYPLFQIIPNSFIRIPNQGVIPGNTFQPDTTILLLQAKTFDFLAPVNRTKSHPITQEFFSRDMRKANAGENETMSVPLNDLSCI